MSVTMILTDKEAQGIELGRQIKNGTGHGSLLTEYRNREESLFTPAPKVQPVGTK